LNTKLFMVGTKRKEKRSEKNKTGYQSAQTKSHDPGTVVKGVYIRAKHLVKPHLFLFSHFLKHLRTI